MLHLQKRTCRGLGLTSGRCAAVHAVRGCFNLHAHRISKSLLHADNFKICRHTKLHASDSRRLNAPDQRSSRRPRRKPPAGAPKLNKEDVQQGMLGQLPLEDMEELTALYESMTDEDKAQFLQFADEAEQDRLREELHGMDDKQLKAYVDRVLNKYDNPSFWDATLVQPLALDVIRERLPPEDSALLGKLLVSDEKTGDIGKGLNTNRPARIGRQLLKLKLHERRQLLGLMERLQQMEEEFNLMGVWKEYMDMKLSLRMLRRAAQKGMLPGDEEGKQQQEEGQGADLGAAGSATDADLDGDEQQSGSPDADADGVSSSAAAAAGGDDERVRSSSGASSSSGSGSNGSSTWGMSFAKRRQGNASSSSSSGSTKAAGAAVPSQRAQDIAALMSSSMERYLNGDGWAEEELEGSRDLRRLKQLIQRLGMLSELAVDDLGESGFTPRAYLEELRAAKHELQLLVATGAESEDAVVREALDFMQAALATAESGGGDIIQIEPVTIGRLAQFVRAAEVWQQYKEFYPNFIGQQQSFQLDVVDGYVAVLGQMNRERWWVREEQDLTEEERAKLAASGCSAALDEERIEVLASLDPVHLRFLSELLGSGYSEEAIVKWSMHPEIGPLLRSGEWLDPSQAMPDLVREAWEEAQQSKVEGVDFKYGVSRSSSGGDDSSEKVKRPPGVPPAAGSKVQKTRGMLWRARQQQQQQQQERRGGGSSSSSNGGIAGDAE